MILQAKIQLGNAPAFWALGKRNFLATLDNHGWSLATLRWCLKCRRWSRSAHKERQHKLDISTAHEWALKLTRYHRIGKTRRCNVAAVSIFLEARTPSTDTSTGLDIGRWLATLDSMFRISLV
jgi:hypothetical protein